MTLSLNVQFNVSTVIPLVSRNEATLSFTSRRTMSRSGLDLEKHRLEERGIRSKTGKS
jgi:hypothetical protein